MHFCYICVNIATTLFIFYSTGLFYEIWLLSGGKIRRNIVLDGRDLPVQVFLSSFLLRFLRGEEVNGNIKKRIMFGGP